jgi:ABC-type antimicrobial peptide transport system permease subunit
MMKLKHFLITLKSINYFNLLKELVFFLRFFLIVIVYLFFDVLRFIGRWPIIRLIANPFRKIGLAIYRKIMDPLNSSEEGEISSLDLVHLAVRHLKLKKVRTFITIGGMSIGFGAVVFLLSLGYGVQRLVISRVARLDEMKQINVSIGQSSSLVINEQTLEDLKKIENVDLVIPMVSVVSKVNFNNSVSDVVAYGVTKQFLEQSAIQPVKGTLFEDYEEDFSKPSEETSLNDDQVKGQVAGAANKRLTGAKLSKELSQIRYSIYPLVWKAVYAEPSSKSKILGYTNRGVGEIDAIEVWGEIYESKEILIEGVDLFGNVFNPWIADSVPIWKKEICDEKKLDCVDGKYQMIKSGGSQELAKGYMMEGDVSIDRYRITASATPTFVEGDSVQSVSFSVPTSKYLEVYSDVFKDAQMLGMYTFKSGNLLVSGELVYGESYYSENGWGNVGTNVNGQNVGYWVRAKLPLWRKVDCSDCQNVYLKDVDSSEKQIESLAYLRADGVVIEDMAEPPMYGRVLGESTASAELASTSFEGSDSAALTEEESSGSGRIALADGSILEAKQNTDGTLDWTSIGGASDSAATVKREVVPLRDSAKKVAVVNRAMLKVLGMDEATAVGQKFNTTFMLDQEFFSKDGYQAESAPTDFTIIGVIPEEKTPAYYLQFNDIKGLGVENYSQVKVVVKDQDNIKKVRQDIEASGFRTNSVVDTVGKINELFNTVRFVLSILGMVALSVAALGMFNTLTVSLLEKTREVGLMKAIGMKSNEVKRLFLAESIVMGLSGGICGLLLSALAGQLLSFALSVISVTKGLGYIQLVYIPFYLGFGVVALSFVIAVVTGMYPSYRATKISALNALRYE